MSVGVCEALVRQLYCPHFVFCWRTAQIDDRAVRLDADCEIPSGALHDPV